MDRAAAEPRGHTISVVVPVVAALASASAVVALAGWALDSEIARAWLPGAAAMNPVTALALVSLAASLWLQYRRESSSRLAQALALAALLFGVLKLASVLAGTDLRFDHFLFSRQLDAAPGLPNRMAPNTALCFTLLGASTWLLARGRRIALGELLALAAGCVAFFAVLGYLYDFVDLYRVSTQIPMAFNTAVALSALSLGALVVRPGHGVAVILSSRGAGGYVARRLLPCVIAVPALLGALRLWGEHAGLYETETGALMMVVVTILLLTGLVVWAASALDRADEEQKAAERALRESSVFLESVFENLPLMVFVKEAAGLRFVRYNRAGEDMIGYSREELIGKSDHDFFPPEEADFFTSKDRDVLRGGTIVDIPEEPIHTRNRGTRILHTRKVPVPGTDGEPRFLLGISEDITERKQAERELEVLNRELEAFSYSVSHDLRAPLRAIVGFSQALLEDHSTSLDETGNKLLARIVAGGQRMSDLIDDLIEFSRLNRADIRCQQVDLSEVARDVARGLQEMDGAREIELHVADDLHTRADPRLMRVVLENLMGNAWKFTRRNDGARVEVGATRANGTPSAFFVRDNGAGFDMQYAHKLFAPFQRLHAAADFEGTGIGLATVQRIVERHGGRVWAESAVGAGTTFYFTLQEG